MLKDLTVKAFIDETASESPAPGGGSIAALSAASAAALISMVANLTLGKKGYEEVQDDMEEIKKISGEFKDKFVNYIDEDSNAFNKILIAFKMPKETEEEKKVRTSAIQSAFKGAATVPLNMAKDAFELLDLAKVVIEKGNQNAVTDGAVAAMCSRTAVLSALYNVKINLSSIKDEEFVGAAQKEIEELESKVNEIEQSLLSKVIL